MSNNNSNTPTHEENYIYKVPGKKPVNIIVLEYKHSNGEEFILIKTIGILPKPELRAPGFRYTKDHGYILRNISLDEFKDRYVNKKEPFIEEFEGHIRSLSGGHKGSRRVKHKIRKTRRRLRG